MSKIVTAAKARIRLSKELKNYVEETVFPKMTGYIKKDTISEETCRKYMLSD